MVPETRNETRACDRAARIAALRERIFAQYRRRTPNSAALFRRAAQCLPGGVSGNLRYFEPYPLYMERGQGCRTVDVDQHTYIDCFSANGPLLLGHNHPAVVESVERHRPRGALPFNPELMVECAERLRALVPCAERVRFLNTGTEAVMTAVRIARAATGKSRVIKFFGHYHGQHDQLMLGLGTRRDAFSAGVPASSLADTLVLPYNDIDALRRTLANDIDVACVILDPAMHAGGLWGSDAAFLRLVREETRKRDVLLVFDEVITGFRLAAGGAQAHFGVVPDLATFAKALAAGEKLAAVAGREYVMRVLDPNAAGEVPRVFQSGTVNDGTAALASAIAAMDTYRVHHERGDYARLDALGTRLAEGIKDAFGARNLPCHVNRLGSMLQIFVSDQEPGFERYHSLDMSVLALFFHALINEGVFLTVPTSDHIYLSFAHTGEDIAEVLEKVEAVFTRHGFEGVF